jgi:hypothetical protein
MKTVIFSVGLSIGAISGFTPSTMIALVGIAVITYLDEISGRIAEWEEDDGE